MVKSPFYVICEPRGAHPLLIDLLGFFYINWLWLLIDCNADRCYLCTFISKVDCNLRPIHWNYSERVDLLMTGTLSLFAKLDRTSSGE